MPFVRNDRRIHGGYGGGAVLPTGNGIVWNQRRDWHGLRLRETRGMPLG